ncbi:hypothetical protein MCAMS1_00742 [biofilm metagenome]
MKRYKIIELLFLLLFSIEVGAQNTQEHPIFNNLIPEDKALALTWLSRSCSVSEKNEFEKKIIARGDAFDPVFWEAYQFGPTEQEIKKINATAITNYRDRINWLEKFGDAQMGEVETKRQLAISEKQYVERVINNYTNGYKTSAVTGLGLVGTVQRGAELNKIANDSENPAQTAAQEALKLFSIRNSTRAKMR